MALHAHDKPRESAYKTARAEVSRFIWQTIKDTVKEYFSPILLLFRRRSSK